MKITIITLFPEIFPDFLNFSILKRAQKKGLVEFEVVNLRDFGIGKHKTVDDRPYGGGAGMILKPDVLEKAVKSLGSHLKGGKLNMKVIMTSASGTTFKQDSAKSLSGLEHLILICGHYEGVDQRFIDKYVDMEISIGDYVLTGGELPALVIADAVTRLLPGVLEKPEATQDESFSGFSLLLEYPQYTRPEESIGTQVPKILLSGDHKKIADWRKLKSREKTAKLRAEGI